MKQLKPTSIVLKEDLTLECFKLRKEASDNYGFKNMWTVNGSIFVKTKEEVEKFVKISNITIHLVKCFKC